MMRGTNTTGALVATGTRSNKKVNQDACAIVQNHRAPLTGVVVADGLGSHFAAEVASRIAAETLRRELELVKEPSGVDMTHLFTMAWHGIEQYVNEHAHELPADMDWSNAFGTTLLCAVETANEVVLGYVGNGAIFHIRGDFNTFPKSQLLPWTAVNYLNPHTFSRGGKNVLYKLLSVRSGRVEATPTILRIRKDLDLMGDIFLVCSDGIYSYDQTPMGRDGDQQIWISGEPTIGTFFENLASFFAGPEHTDAALTLSIERYLAEINRRNLITDDCTLGVLITETTLRYQERIRRPQADEVIS